MMLSISFILRGEAEIKAFLTFVFPMSHDDIALANINTPEDVKLVVDPAIKTSVVAKTRDKLISEKFVKHLPLRNIDLLTIDKAALRGQYQLNSLLHVTVGNEPLAFIASVRYHTKVLDSIGDYDFYICLSEKKVTMKGVEICKIDHIADLNIPLGLNPSKIHDNISEMFTLEELVVLALMIMPRYELDFITVDVIAKAQQLCIEKGLLTKEDIDFLEAERKFIVSGVQYEHKASWY